MANTDEQLAIIKHIEYTRFDEIVRLLSFATRCKEAIVSLPHKNEHGESVVHGDNMVMHGLASSYAYMAQNLYSSLPRLKQIEISEKFPEWRGWIK